MGSNKFTVMSKATGKLCVAMGLLFSLVGCQGFQSPDAFSDLEKAAHQKVAAPVCEVNEVDYQLDEQVIDFNVTDTTKLSFGFNLLTGIFKAIGININATKAVMDTQMKLFKTLDTTSAVANSIGSATARDLSFDFSLDIWYLHAGGGNTHVTPMSTMTGNTIGSGLKNLAADLAKHTDPWSTRIIKYYAPLDEWLIPAGSVAGLLVGDEFQIYNVGYIWQDDSKPCASNLQFEPKLTAVALGVVDQINENYALIKVYDKITSNPIVLGAKLYVQNLPPSSTVKTRNLLRSVMVNAKSSKLKLTTGDEVDLSGYLDLLTPTQLRNYGFYQRQAEVNPIKTN